MEFYFVQVNRQPFVHEAKLSQTQVNKPFAEHDLIAHIQVAHGHVVRAAGRRFGIDRMEIDELENERNQKRVRVHQLNKYECALNDMNQMLGSTD